MIGTLRRIWISQPLQADDEEFRFVLCSGAKKMLYIYSIFILFSNQSNWRKYLQTLIVGDFWMEVKFTNWNVKFSDLCNGDLISLQLLEQSEKRQMHIHCLLRISWQICHIARVCKIVFTLLISAVPLPYYKCFFTLSPHYHQVHILPKILMVIAWGRLGRSCTQFANILIIISNALTRIEKVFTILIIVDVQHTIHSTTKCQLFVIVKILTLNFISELLRCLITSLKVNADTGTLDGSLPYYIISGGQARKASFGYVCLSMLQLPYLSREHA